MRRPKLRGNDMELVDRNKAIEMLEKMKAEREKRTCSRSSIYEARALGYAIAILKRLPKENG